MTNRIAELLRKRNWTQNELAVRCGLRESQISKYISEVNSPNLATAKRIARELGVSVETVFPEPAAVKR